MRPRSTAVFVTLMIIGIALPILYSKKEMDNKKAIRYAWQKYQTSAGLLPPLPKITTIEIDGQRATITLTDEKTGADSQKQTITGNASFILEGGKWTFHKVEWLTDGNTQEKNSPAAGATAGTSEAPLASISDSHIANVIIENEPYTFVLATGPDSATDLTNPEQASIEYQVDHAKDPLAPIGSAPHKLQLILRFNAAKTGFYITGQENIALQFLRDGQLFEPASDCLIEIRAPYTGEDLNSLSGMVRDCRVHAAGIEYQLVMMEFAPSSMHEGTVERPAAEARQE